MTVLEMSKEIFQFIKDAFSIYTIEEKQQLADIQILKNQSAIDLAKETTSQLYAAKKFVDSTGLGYLTTAFSGWVNPLTTIPLVASNVMGEVGNHVKDVWTFFGGTKDGRVRSRNRKIAKSRR
jgi:hypothetical protein